ncbi:GatB/YqeY domain-containing protein [candidate division KSB1 bacterium]|nr:GatB/YqeY domain-containing protein [candidate division KSB1 bacterium]
MSLLSRLTEDMKSAMKTGDKERLNTIRLLRGQIKDAAINQQKELDEEEEIAVLANAAKKRRESILAFQNAGRNDLVEKESNELGVIQEYLPEQLGSEEIEKIVEIAIKEAGAQTIKDLGKVMPLVMAKVKGRADGKVVSQMVKNKLSL